MINKFMKWFKEKLKGIKLILKVFKVILGDAILAIKEFGSLVNDFGKYEGEVSLFCFIGMLGGMVLCLCVGLVGVMGLVHREILILQVMFYSFCGLSCSMFLVEVFWLLWGLLRWLFSFGFRLNSYVKKTFNAVKGGGDEDDSL